MKIKTYLSGRFVILLLLAFSGFAYAAGGRVKGKVQDAQTNEPLPFCNVILLGTSFGSATDFDGIYQINAVPPGKYILKATFIGYKPEEVSIEVKEGKTTEYNFHLSAESVYGDTIVITAQAEGQAKAINEQLTSITIKNVVSFAKIRELPDANAAESVARLPGVSLIRTGGEGSRVVVRGLSPQYNRVTVDGVELPANVTSNDPNEHRSEFKAGDELSLSGDRATDLSMISSNMLGGIEVVKAITPDMDATLLGGVINFSMRKAIKTTTGKPSFELFTQGSHNSLKNTNDDYKFVASYEQRFWNNSFGIFAQGSAEDRNLSANELSADYNFAGKLNITDEGEPEFRSMTLTDVLRDRKRYGATVVLDYKYSNGSIGFMNFFSRSNTKTISRKESYHLLDDDLFYSATNSENNLDILSNLLSISHSLAGFGIELRLSHSYSKTTYPNDVSFNFWQNGAGFENKFTLLRYQRPQVIASNIIYDPEDAVFFDIYNIDNISKDRTYNGTLDIIRDITISKLVNAKIKFGGAYQYRKRSYDYNQSSGSVFYDDGGQVAAAVMNAFPQFGTSITFADFIDSSYSYGEFLSGDYQLGPPLNVDLMMQVIEVAKKNPGAGNGGGYKPHKLSSILYDYSGHEVKSAAYFMTSINFGQKISFIPGVRYQNLTTTYRGIRGEQIPGDIQYTEAEETQSHGYWLPMVHLRYKPTDWLQFHFAYTNTLNYPDYNSIIPRYYIGTNYILYNNYRLKPARSENFDAIMSIYANEIGLFSIGGFKKQIKDLVFPTKTYPQDFSAYPELQEKLKNRTESFALYTYINNPIPIDLVGIEGEWQAHFWYLPEPLTGLVFNINYTHIFSEADYPKTYLITILDENYIQHTVSVDTSYSDRLLYQPNDIINVALGYDYKGFSFRVSMLYQDNIFKRPDFWYQNRVHSDKYVRFDLSFKQELPWYGIQIYLNINNLTGEDDIDINQKTKYVTNQQRYGMMADLGMRLRF
ncbi:TonB-dependent receptor domain-containing protein [Melioribacter sp. OK-6-Me]|uniref:TonB-dependent receptor n=1 Tax=unclassified Melioribacter TaxID=2627329 RepID=UPI003ED887A1